MTYQAFVNEWNGKQVTRYGGQCVALVAEFEAESNLPICWANAKDWADNATMLGAYDWHAGAPDANTPQGAIVVWNSALPGSGGQGHIDLFDHWTGNGFVGFDQNWGGAAAHMQAHNLIDIAGYFTKKAAPPTPAPHPDPAPVGHTITLEGPYWHLYNANGPFDPAHAKATLAPAKYGGLTYAILGSPRPNFYLIQTKMFGLGAVYGGKETGAIIK